MLDDDTQPVDASTAATQKSVILEESEERSLDRDAAPGSSVEHRTSDEATPPVE
ncbi:MAG: hypothetical protein M3Q68_03395 [Actinomycetota bacterium]|nr:hypothetical protein [Actinomycetota bacterium]